MENFILMFIALFIFYIIAFRKDAAKIIRKWDEPFEKKTGASSANFFSFWR